MAIAESIRIDAHQHFWRYHPVTHEWITADMSVIRKDFLPGNLQPLLEQYRFNGCIAVQADQSESETAFLTDLAKGNRFIRAVVGWVDLCSIDIRERLAYYSHEKIVKGFRHILQSEEPDFMLTGAFLRGIAALAEFGFTYDILIYPRHIQAATELVKRFPQQLFVIDHLAKPPIRNGTMAEWESGMRSLAAFPNVYCKVSGLVTEADWQHWTQANLFPYLSVVTEAFGTSRLLYGSDWPVCLVAADYGEMLAPVQRFFSTFTQGEQQAIFGGNAVEFYHL